MTVYNAYEAFEELRPTVLIWKNKLRSFLPRCYAAIGDIDKAAAEIIMMAQNFVEIAQNGTRYQDAEEAKTEASGEIQNALKRITKDALRDEIKAHDKYTQAVNILENIR